MTSSRYTKQEFHLYGARMTSKARWKEAEALVKPNGIRLNWNKSSFEQNAGFLFVLFAHGQLSISPVDFQRA